MFENIVGHEQLVAALRRELQADRFPRASLIHGPAYSGKCSLALEIARVLGCELQGAWGCRCAHCCQHLDLSYPYLLMLGWRYFEADIRAAAATLGRVESDGARYLFARSARRLTRRYDPLLWEGEESKLRTVAPLVAEVNELAEEIVPPSALAADDLRAAVARIAELATKLQAALRSDNIAIAQLRNVESWLPLSTDQGRKVVILEHAEGMGESSRNALLRLLEEPPRDCHVILLTRRADALNATLRSRLREYSTASRSIAVGREVITKIFRDDATDAASLRGFFLGFHDPPPAELREAATRFVERVLERAGVGRTAAAGPPTPATGYAAADRLSRPLDREAFVTMLEEVAEVVRAAAAPGAGGLAVDPSLAARWAEHLDHAHASVMLLRQQPGHVLQRLGVAMADAARHSSSTRPGGQGERGQLPAVAAA